MRRRAGSALDQRLFLPAAAMALERTCAFPTCWPLENGDNELAVVGRCKSKVTECRESAYYETELAKVVELKNTNVAGIAFEN